VPIRISCIYCNDFFTPSAAEVSEFIKYRADAKYLRRIPFPKDQAAKYETREAFVSSLLVACCPYCREVKFGRAASPDLPDGNVGIDKYLKCIESEFRKNGGADIRDIPEDYIALVNDED